MTWWTRHDTLDPDETDSEDDFAQDEDDEKPVLGECSVFCSLEFVLLPDCDF